MARTRFHVRGLVTGPATAMNIRRLRKTEFRFARPALFGALICTHALGGVTGDAIVMHEHGLRKAHLHVLGYTEVLYDVASSPRFGHPPTTPFAGPSAFSGVHILAILITGPTFAPESNEPDDILLGQDFAISKVGAVDMPRTTSFVHANPSPQPRTASTAILLRNHTLLL